GPVRPVRRVAICRLVVPVEQVIGVDLLRVVGRRVVVRGVGARVPAGPARFGGGIDRHVRVRTFQTHRVGSGVDERDVLTVHVVPVERVLDVVGGFGEGFRGGDLVGVVETLEADDGVDLAHVGRTQTRVGHGCVVDGGEGLHQAVVRA